MFEDILLEYETLAADINEGVFSRIGRAVLGKSETAKYRRDNPQHRIVSDRADMASTLAHKSRKFDSRRAHSVAADKHRDAYSYHSTMRDKANSAKDKEGTSRHGVQMRHHFTHYASHQALSKKRRTN